MIGIALYIAMREVRSCLDPFDSYRVDRSHLWFLDSLVTSMATETRGESILRVRLGTALQRHRLRRGLTQAQLAELADLSLKYVGEIERGEANTTLEALERLARAVDWDPMEALDTVREPVSEGVRVLLIGEISRMLDRFKIMLQWLEALDPVFIAKTSERRELAEGAEHKSRPKIGRRRKI